MEYRYNYRVYVHRSNDNKTELLSCCMSRGFDDKKQAYHFVEAQNNKPKRIAILIENSVDK